MFTTLMWEGGEGGDIFRGDTLETVFVMPNRKIGRGQLWWDLGCGQLGGYRV